MSEWPVSHCRICGTAFPFKSGDTYPVWAKWSREHECTPLRPPSVELTIRDLIPLSVIGKVGSGALEVHTSQMYRELREHCELYGLWSTERKLEITFRITSADEEDGI